MEFATQFVNKTLDVVNPLISRASEKPALFIGASLATLIALRAVAKPNIEQVHCSDLPQGIDRTFLEGPNGKIELLVSNQTPNPSKKDVPPLLFVHGGFGNAHQFVMWMSHLSSLGFKSYSISLYGHGASDKPIWLTVIPRSKLEADLVATIDYITQVEGKAPVMVGHSSGGGLSQAVLYSGKAKVSGLIPLASIPFTGGKSVYQNWAKEDPWCFIRLIYDLGDMRSPLSTPLLVKNIFFSKDYEGVEEFSKTLNRGESYFWATSMMLKYADASKIKESCESRVFVIGGDEDKLMTPNIVKDLATEFGCPHEIVPRSGHMIMVDTNWKEAADVVAKKVEEWFP